MTSRAFTANRDVWNQWTRLHTGSEFYDVDGFLAGNSTLNPLEVDELGPVSDKSLLHLQCHFGLDTLSWARKGARVTGVDLSTEAVDAARDLARRASLDAEFIAANVYDLPGVIERKYDIVFTSYGVLNWLPDLGEWARIIAASLTPGGTFYMMEFHPFPLMFGDEPGDFAFPYFPGREPLVLTQRGSYAAPESEREFTCHEWPYTLGGVVTALSKAGLRLQFLHEFDYLPFNCYPFLEADGPNRFVLKKVDKPHGPVHPFPLLFSIRASLQ